MQKHANLVDLVKSFPTSIYLQNLASIQPRTSLVKFARSPHTDRPGHGKARLSEADDLRPDLLGDSAGSYYDPEATFRHLLLPVQVYVCSNSEL